MDNDKSKEDKKQPGEFTELFSAYIPVEPPEPKPDEKLNIQPRAAQSERALGGPIAPPVKYEPQRPERTVRIPLVKNPQEPGEFTRVFDAMQQPASTAPPSPPAARVNMPTAPPAGPGEFTRTFSAPSIANQPPRPAEPVNRPAAPEAGPGDFTRTFSSPASVNPAATPARPVASRPTDPAANLDQLGSFRPFPAQPPSSPPIRNAPGPQDAAEFTRLFSSPLPASEGKVNWAAIESQPAPLPGPKAAGDFTQMFGRPDLGFSSPPESASGSLNSPKADASVNSFTALFSRPTVDSARAQTEGPASPSPAKPAAAEQKQAGAPVKAQAPKMLLLLAIVLGVILILAVGALYFFVLRK